MWFKSLKRKNADSSEASGTSLATEPMLSATEPGNVEAQMVDGDVVAGPSAEVTDAQQSTFAPTEVVVPTRESSTENSGTFAEQPDADKRKGRFSFKLKRRPAAEKRKTGALPIRVFIGYLPEVTERDARDYALGVAEKHFEQPAIAWFDAFRYGEGFAYEVHEGGSGHAYLPEIIKHFQDNGPYRSDESLEVVLQTGTRKVKVYRQRAGLQAVLLPESSREEPADWLRPTEKLTSALNQRTGFLVAGAGFFVASFFALIITALLARYQPYEAPPEPLKTIVSYEQLPIAQWKIVESLSGDEYVSKLVYEKKHWLQPVIQRADNPSAGQPVSTAPAGASSSLGASAPLTPVQPAMQGSMPVTPALPAAVVPAGPMATSGSIPVVPPAGQRPVGTAH